MEGMLRDAFNMYSHGEQSFPPDFIASDDCNIGENVFYETGTSAPDEEPNEEAAKFYNLLNKMNEELYEGSKYSKLSFCIRLLHLKCLGGWTGNSFTMLLEFLREMFSFAKIPQSCQDMKRLIKDLGLRYDRIHSCPIDCMLYWGDQKNQQSCHVCGKSRWMDRNAEDVNADEGGAQLRKKPVKALRYFPLIPRLQRLFMSSKTAESMRWHNDQRTDDGLLRHPVDSLAWKSFDSKFSSFASDPRNVRLELAADGFNPFKIMSTSYSTWPVVLVPYNLPLWICMKQSSFILSMIIPGEKALLWTINDFPAYANLSGLSTKGCYACPCCAVQTCSKWLYNGKKFSYMGHRRWLDGNHKFRFQKTLFDGTEEYRGAPEQTVGSEILFMLKDINFSYGKINQPLNTQTKRRSRYESDDESNEEDDPNEANLWKKRIDMRIWRDLHPQVLPNGKYQLPPSIFSMSKEEKEVFCMVLKDIKIYSQLLYVDVCQKNVTSCIIELSNIMKAICGKVLDVEELEKVQDRVALTLCNLEKIFPPSFFTIMMHLVIHIPHEAILGGLVWSGKDVNDEVKWLSQGPNRVIKRYSAFLINGYRFHTKYRERMRRTQNCEIVVNSSITSYASARDSNPVEGNVEYYGLLTDIIELDYYGRWKVILFRCDWADVNTAREIKKDQFGFTMVNFSRFIHTGQQLMDEPYVFSYQVKQVFYSKDPTDEGWYVVLRNTPRDLFDMGNESRDDIVERSETLPFPEQNLDENIPSTRKMRRRRLRDLSIVQNTQNSEEANCEQQKLLDLRMCRRHLTSLENFKVMLTESGGTRRGRGRTLLKDLYDLDPVEHVKPDSNKNQALANIKERFALKKDISLEEKLRNVPPGMLRYQWEDADREQVGTSSRQKQKFTHTAGSKSFASVIEAKEKLKEKKAEYEAIASTDSSVNLENIDNRIITEVLGPERYGRVRFQGSGVTPTQYFGSDSQQYMPSGSQAQAEVQRFRDQIAQMQANTVEQIAEFKENMKNSSNNLERRQQIGRQRQQRGRQRRAESTISSSYTFSR
ncbi:hypothetical protein CXB51_028628 [Gossypium anomalum]|uniref:DUF4216 domain-containing protein n=1 Tax=Gossypium anomalum TaxID=47600 RepID=A0A8J5YCU1_9ROSI|nr:hypothetical protein CXB51_028628 [Gossypium anomalum]